MNSITGTSDVIPISKAIALMQPADWVFYRGSSWSTYGIRIASLSPYSHVGMVAFRDNDEEHRYPILLDTVQWRGARAVSLVGEVNRHPGRYVWFQTNPQNRWPEFDRQKAVNRMWDFTGINYGWGALMWASFVFLPGVRLFQKVDKFLVDEEATNNLPPFCSMAVGIATEAGGVDPVRNLRHSLTTPGVMSQSLFVRCMGALIPDEK